MKTLRVFLLMMSIALLLFCTVMAVFKIAQVPKGPQWVYNVIGFCCVYAGLEISVATVKDI